MEENVVSTYLIPGVLALMMVGMGMTLRPADFKRVFIYPKAVITGLLAQVLLLPALGLLIALLIPMPAEFAVGLMIISLCPGGVGSNLLTLIARADTALSVTLTALSNALLIFTLPLFVNLSLQTFMGAETPLQLPVLQTILTTAFLTIAPILLGMVLRAFAGDFAQRAEGGFRVFSGVFLVLLMLSIGLKNRDVFLQSVFTLGPAVIALNLGSMALGFALAVLVRLNRAQCTTVAIETGFQNAALAILVTTTFLHNPQMALAPALYGGIMFLGAFVLIGALKLQRPLPAPAR